MIVVSNTTPLSELFKLGELDLLRIVYDHILIPQAVWDELRQARNFPALASTVEQAEWIEVRVLQNPTAVQELQQRYARLKLGRGECATIALASELNATRVILDDRNAREAANAEGLPLIGTLGVLLLAHRQQLITAEKAREILDKLYRGDFHLSRTLYQTILDQITLQETKHKNT
jgi:hypothetical protein